MAGSIPASQGRIFISYRRQDTDFPAGWLYERLANHFSGAQVFKDVDSIELGDDFGEMIAAAVGSCDVLLAVIGEQWLAVTDEDGRRRLDDPNDFVRLEIEAALSRKVRVIPILVDRARDALGRRASGKPGQADAEAGPPAEPQPLRRRHKPAAQGAGEDPCRGGPRHRQGRGAHRL